MFKSERLPIIVPQQEHARLAGALAMRWGNDIFDRPSIPIESLAKGLIFHHVGYGSFDTVAFRELSEKGILEVFEKDIAADLGDVDAELVNLFHQLRLIKNRLARTNSKGFLKLQEKVELMISTKLPRSNFEREDFERANRITHLCDRLSFNFSQGAVAEANVDVFARRGSSEKIGITNELVGTDTIVVDPWPFTGDEVNALIIAYAADQYPEVLIPYLIQVSVIPRK